MKKTKMVAIAVGLAMLSGGAWMYSRADAKEATAYRLTTVERGNLQATVSATGTLNAVRTVQVGTQVSGQVSAIYVDFNAKVKKGQLLARIDPTLQQQAVQDAQAGLDRANAQLDLSKQEFDRNSALFDKKIVTAAEFGTAKANYAVAQANAKSAGVALSRARQNLAYTNIYSPIDGVIVERNVDVGQTVAASLSAPQLFLIANDLSQMQILASVDESDIGSIKQGQEVQFTVQSFPNRPFVGRVSQVRLQSKTQDNVVNYTAVVTVENPNGALLPGMTATAKFLTGSANNALTVVNSALRYRPTAEMLAQAGVTPSSASGRRDSTQRRASGEFAGQFAAGSQARTPGVGSRGALWYVGPDGKLKIVRVRTGLTDGQKTVVESDSLKAGMQVIIGTTGTSQAATATATSTSTNPLQPQGRGPGGQRGP
jgi:HlyD family secretion protein